MCLTETQHKYLRVNIDNNIEHTHSHTKENYQKGAGLGILTTKNQAKHMKKTQY